MGSLGSCRAYFEATLQKLEAMGVKDAGMEGVRLALIAAEGSDCGVGGLITANEEGTS